MRLVIYADSDQYYMLEKLASGIFDVFLYEHYENNERVGRIVHKKDGWHTRDIIGQWLGVATTREDAVGILDAGLYPPNDGEAALEAA